MIVKLIDEPGQPAPVGVTVIVPEIGPVVALVAVKAAILPVPLAARPIAVLEFVQLYTVPATEPVKVTAVVVAPVHTVWSATALTFAPGLTVIVKLTGVPGQLMPPLVNTGVIVIVATCGTAVLLIARKAPISPIPPAANPMLVLLLVQL